MKHVIVLVLLTAASSAVAAPVALDYRASDPSCIDGGRFSDEISAKLGYVPWSTSAPATIRIRVERDGTQFTGTFRNVDGSAKIIDGKTCADVTESLIVTVATALDPTARPAPAAAPPAPTLAVAPGGAKHGALIPVTFRSSEGRRISIEVQTSSGYGVASDGTGVAAAYFDSLCTSPCTARLPQGRNYLSFTDPDRHVYGGGGYLFDRPTTLTLARKSRRGTRLGLLLGGAAATGLGTWLATECSGSSCTGPVVGGITMATLGFTSMLTSLLVHDTFSVSQSP